MPSIRTAVIFSSGGKYILKVIALISTMVIARLLTPEEIGTFAIASSVVMIMADFRIMGANAFLIREKNLTTQAIRSAYGLTILISWSFGILIALSAPFLSDYFNIPDINLIFIILSTTFIFAPFISIPHALLSREYRFKEITIIKLVSAILQLLITLLLIELGYSYFALAWGHFFAMSIQLLLSLYFTRSVRIYTPSFKGIKPIAKLGIFTSVAHVLRKSQQTVPDIVIGKMGNPIQVGMFSRGMGFINFTTDSVLTGISPVTLPYLSNVKNNEHDLASAYTYASKLILVLILPVLAVASVASLPAIRLMFGPQWDEAAPIAAILAYWSMIKSIHVLSPNALIAFGHERVMLIKESVVFTFFIAILIKAFPMGLKYFAFAFVLTAFLDFLLSSIILSKILKISNYYFLKQLLPTFIISLTCWLAAYGLNYITPFDDTPPISVLLHLLLTMPIIWIFMIFITKHPISSELLKVFGALKSRWQGPLK